MESVRDVSHRDFTINILSLSPARELKRLTNVLQRAKSSPAAEYYNNNNNINSLKTLSEIKLYTCVDYKIGSIIKAYRRYGVNRLKTRFGQLWERQTRFPITYAVAFFGPNASCLYRPPVFDICWDLHTSSSVKLRRHRPNVLFKAPR